jgi:nucleoside-diphosphate-sugar epimerase
MRILVTGGEGFIGTHLCRELAAGGHEVLSIDIKPLQASGEQSWAQLLRCDLLLPAAGETSMFLNHAIAGHEPDVVVHLAAQVGRLFGEDNLAHTIESNALMTALVARSCAAASKQPRLVYTSTSEVYGDLGAKVALEDDGGEAMTIPHNLYGLSKRWGEEVSALYAVECGLQVVRPSMPYGPGLPPGRGRAAIVNMLWQASNRERIVVHRGAERSWCWIGDAVRGFRVIIEQGEVASHADSYREGLGCYNLGRDDAGVPMLAVAQMACYITGADESLIEQVDAPGRQTVVKRLATTKLRALGWQPHVGLRDGMVMTWQAMLKAGQLDRSAVQ